ncbi:hypothetical protein ACYPKM_03240 [Pseudomonas aeruginosa]
MLFFTHVDPEMGVVSKAELGQFSLTVKVDGLPVATFHHKRARELVLSKSCHKAKATILGMHLEKSWRLPLDRLSIIEKMCKSLTAAGFPVLASALMTKKSEMMGLPDAASLSQYWESKAEPFLRLTAAKKGLVDRTDSLDKALFSAHPHTNSYLEHPRANHFANKAWPAIIPALQRQMEQRLKAAL